MNKIFKKSTLLLLLIMMQINVKGQVLPKVEQGFNTYQANFQEKIFVHTDKDQYMAGELIWFKIYLVNYLSQKPSALSKLAYVELLDQNNKPIVQAKIALHEGSGNASLTIPGTVANGVYKFRSYTNWMKNFGASSFFEKNMVVLNGQVLPEKIRSDDQNIDLQFFPEGGDMVEGIPTNIGFKAVGANGNGINVRGAILNQKNDTVTKFQSLKFGIGKFKFTPQENTNYKAVIFSNGKTIVKNFPVAKKQGYSMLLANEGTGNLQMNVNTNINASKVYLLVHNKEKISLASTAELINGKASFQIEQAKLGDGVSHFTIFNEQEQAVAERLYFKKGEQKLVVNAQPDKTTYPTRSKINVMLSVSETQTNANAANLSLSVRRLDSLQKIDDANIESYLSLCAELKGDIESANYYFQSDDTQTKQALDNLLITQGWRRFNWNDVLAGKPQIQFLPEYNGHLIYGKLTAKDGSPAKYTNMYMGVLGSRIQFYESLSDANGSFVFNTKDLYGNKEVVLQAERSDSTSTIAIKSPFSEQYTPAKTWQFEWDKNLINDFQTQNLSVQIQNNYVQNQLDKFANPKVDSSAFYGKPFKTYAFNDYQRFRTMEESLREIVKETIVSKSGSDFHVKLVTSDISLDDDPLVLIDGMPYFSINTAMRIDPNKIERLEIVPEKFRLGSSKFDGILSFYSFKPTLANIEINPNTLVVDYEGMALQREFYSPLYETSVQLNNRLPDFRNVLYWLPIIELDATGKAKIEFYSSDLLGQYVGTVNGISKDGKPGATTFIFEVKGKN